MKSICNRYTNKVIIEGEYETLSQLIKDNPNADLSYVNLRNVNLRNADLRNVNLRNADLS